MFTIWSDGCCNMKWERFNTPNTRRPTQGIPHWYTAINLITSNHNVGYACDVGINGVSFVRSSSAIDLSTVSTRGVDGYW